MEDPGIQNVTEDVFSHPNLEDVDTIIRFRLELAVFRCWEKNNRQFLWAKYIINDLVGGFNPFQKYARQIGSFPQVGVKKKKCLKPPPSDTL